MRIKTAKQPETARDGRITKTGPHGSRPVQVVRVRDEATGPGTPWWDHVPQSCACGYPNFPAVDLEVATSEENLWEMHKADPDPYGVGGCPFAQIGEICPSHPTGEVLPDFDGLETGEFRSLTLPEQARRMEPTWDGSTRQERDKAFATQAKLNQQKKQTVEALATLN